MGLIDFSTSVPALAQLNDPVLWVFLFGFGVTLLLLVKRVKGALLAGIAIAALIGISETISFSEAWAALPSTFGVIFTDAGLVSHCVCRWCW